MILMRIFDLVCNISPKIKKLLFRLWYQYISKLDKEGQVIFMNYGYGYPNSRKIKLKDADETNRYSIQLYHHVASAIDVRGLDILEVGCGRGGGSSYIMSYLKPKSLIGVDISEKSIEFCNDYYSIKGLSFLRGDAESLPFNNNVFDVVINIESSHCYGRMEKFLSEVFRVLHPNGYFLFADLFNKDRLASLHNKLKDSSLELLKEERITPNIVKALDIDNKRKLRLIKQKTPKMLHKVFVQFAAIKGTPTYESLKNGNTEYLSFVLHKSLSKS